MSDIRHITAADITVRVRAIDGDPDRPPLLFLHEGLGCIALWRDFPDALCARTGHPGLIYDRKGYGGSTLFSGKWPRDYLMTESTVYLPAVMDACGIDAAILVGHSDGGTIALMGAAALPNRVRAAVTLAAHIFVENETVDGIRRAVEAYRATDLKSRLARYHGDNTETAFCRWADTWLDPDFRDWNIQSWLPRIASPLLVIQGEKDEYATPAQVNGIAAGVSGPVETIMVPHCGHSPHIEAREAALSAISSFLTAFTRTRR